MKYKLFIDDERFPPSGDKSWHVVRNVFEVLSNFAVYGNPEVISFDHDLGMGHIDGYEIAKLLCRMDWEGEIILPMDIRVHSANPVGAENIRNLFDNHFERKPK